ncbi:Ig-like domain-containing protein [Algibacillus agarilyticus]|uniref:Ig-like domain-containing protein n=1 Tax=Algibacillus agarilyticus TaxID=2234133 RepID=UPI000DD09F54|nr:Ig-like domain-containing protein [Algibacillus agarilyticus]
MSTFFKRSKCTHIIATALATLSFNSIAAETTITIDPNTQKYIGDNSELNRAKFFNLHSTPTSSEYTPADLQLITEELNAGFGRSFWSPISASGNTLYPTTEYAQTNGAVNIENLKANPLFPYIDNRLIVTDHPYNVMREGNNPIEGARWAADYFEHYYDDATRPLFYEPMNEPFVHAQDFVDGPWDPAQNLIVQDQMTEWFKEIGSEFDRRNINTKIIGYSSAWPSMELDDFDHWNTRQKRFMDVAGEYMDAFSFHLYDGVNVTGQDNIRSGSNAEAIMDLIETYSHYKWDTVKPHALSEYGGIIDGYEGVDYSPERSSQELRALNHLLFSALAREDRLLTSIPFITGKATWFYEANNFQPYSAAMFRPDPDKIIGNKVNGFLLTEKAKFFQLWSEVKGNRIAINEQDPDLAAQAFAYGPKVYVALNNLEDDTKSIALNFINDLTQVEQVRIKRLNIPYGEAAIYTDETANNAPNELILAAHETVIVEYKFAQAFKQNSIVRTQSYYADEHLQPITADTEIVFNINDVDLNINEASFADFMEKQFIVNEAAALAVKPKHYAKLQEKLIKLDARFANIKAKHPDDWQTSKRLSKLVARTQLNTQAARALNLHYHLNGKSSDNNTAMLRMGIGRKHEKSKAPALLVNGNPVTVPNDWAGYDQAARSDFFGSIEIPVPAEYLQTNNVVSVTFPDSDGRVSSMILEVETPESMQSVAVSGISLNQSDWQINKDKPRRIVANVAPLNATQKFVTWQSSDTNIATIDNDGMVTPIQPGFFTITATTLDGGFTATTHVEVLDQLSINNTVTIIEDTSDEIASDTYTIRVAYSSDVERDIGIEMRSPTNQWLGATKTTVPAGEGEVDLVLTFAEPLAAGTGYKWITGLRTVEGDWRTNVDSHTLSGIVIHPEDWQYTDDSIVNIIADTHALLVQPSYKITVQYTAVVESDITFDLSHTTGWKGGTRTTVQPGTGEVDLTVWPTEALTPDVGYRFLVSIREVGGNWQTDYANAIIDNIEILAQAPEQEPDSNLISNLDPSFETGTLTPWATAWDIAGTATVTNDAAFEGDYGLSIDTTSGKVGIVLDQNTLPQDLYQLGKRIKISFDAKRDTTGAWVGGFAQFWNNSGAWVGSAQQWFEIKSDWTRIEFEIDGEDFTAGGTHLQFNFNAAGHVFSVDNFKIEDVTP